MKQKVIIVGAGIGGLAAANLLAQKGYEVHVYEMHDRPGGRAGTKTVGDFTFDTGPSWYLMPGVFERYYQLLNEDIASHLDLERLSPAYRVFFEDTTTIDITSDIETDAATFESYEKGAGEALKRYAKRAVEIYDLSLKYFLYTSFDSAKSLLRLGIFRHAGSMLHLALTPIHNYVATFVKHKKLQQILEYPMVFLGTSPFEAPALYSLMGALDFKEGVFYPQGGLYTIIESLVDIGKKHGVTYHYSAPVQSIDVKQGRASGITLRNGTSDTADIVLSNADLHHTETKLIADAKHRSYPERYWKHKQPSPSALLMYLGVRGSIDRFTHHNLVFVDDWKQNFDQIKHSKTPLEKASMYICNPNKTDPTVAPKGHENLFVLVPLPADVTIEDDKLHEVADHYIKQIEASCQVTIHSNIIERSYMTPDDFSSQLHSWRKSMLGPSHILKQSAFFRTKNKSKKVNNLYYVGASTLPGIGLPMCLIGAEIVVDRIEKERRDA